LYKRIDSFLAPSLVLAPPSTSGRPPPHCAAAAQQSNPPPSGLLSPRRPSASSRRQKTFFARGGPRLSSPHTERKKPQSLTAGQFPPTRGSAAAGRCQESV
jgi:hypothetical protein